MESLQEHNQNKQDCRNSREDQLNYDPCVTASARLAQDGRWKPTLITLLFRKHNNNNCLFEEGSSKPDNDILAGCITRARQLRTLNIYIFDN